MTHSPFKLIISWVLVGIMFGAGPTQADDSHSDMMLVGEALKAGMKAEADGDAKAMLNAANRLTRLGAKPAAEQNDLAKLWQSKAISLGAHQPIKPVFRGRTLGPSYRQVSLSAEQSFMTEQSFNAGQKASISLIAPSSSKLTLAVTDSNGDEHCKRTLEQNTMSCSWFPTWTDRLHILISNQSKQSSQFVLLTN